MAKICQYDKMSLIMKKHFLMFTFIFSSLMLFAQPDFKPLAYFRLMGIVDLRREKGLDKYERFWLYITPDMKILEYEE